ncbi:hypothetical protein Pint_27748 [Pistacia integerrima]|uniref:Uncharacterized protein n=1 Tax=Pistacia integerrima TaxID=434235 RepID=A0ACC0YNF3_9ROSI|nr:hypothetical protein Pint_27748 [Pistacia integerrima]
MFPNFMIFSILLLLPFASSVSFNYSSFPTNIPNIIFEGDAFPSNDVLQLTKNQADNNLTRSVGRATYNQPVIIWDAKTRRLTDFTAHFSFIIKALNTSNNGDGITFFFAPFDSTIPDNSTGGYLALFSPDTAKTNTSKQIVAVEFDSFQNEWDPSSDHVGINVNSIISVATVDWKSSIKNGSRANAWVSYNSGTQNLSVFLTYADKPVFIGNSSLWYIVDLREVLPERVKVGFSASTSEVVEIHNIISWSFSSTLDETKGKTNVGLIAGLTVGIGALICGLGVILFIWWRKTAGVNTEDEAIDEAIDDEFEKGTGPKRFTYLLAGTMGYLAPECVTTGKASKESDVYSFGVVALEITCGRRPVEPREEPSKVRLVEWVWDLYGKGQLLEAADKRLMRDFDERQMECLMIIGLWCCHPDYTLRPSIRQVINVLNFQAPLPSLPAKLPVPMYYAPPMDLCKFTYTSSGVTQSSVNSYSTYSSTSAGSTTDLLNSRKADT